MAEFEKEVVDTFKRLKDTVDGMTDRHDASKPLDGSVKEQVRSDIDKVIDHREKNKPWPFQND